MTPIENIQEFRSVGASNVFFFAHSLHAAYKWPKWPDHGASNGAVIFYDAGFSAKLRSC